MSGSFGSLADLVKHFESSGGNYSAVNPTSGASGAYQFVPSTWHQYASQIGVDTVQYPTAASAPPAVQDAVFTQAVSKRGLGDWTCPGCNPGLSSYLASNPDAANLPISSATAPTSLLAQHNAPPDPSATPHGFVGPDGTISQDPATLAVPGSSVASGGADPAMLATGYPLDLGIQPGLTMGITKWIGDIETSVGTAFKGAVSAVTGSVTNYFLRFMLILTALVIVAIALWRLIAPDVSVADVAKAVSA